MKARNLALYCMIILLAVWLLSCDNGGTEPNGNDDDTTSTTSLVVDFWQPEDGATDVSTGATLYVRICDTATTTPSGVNLDSIFFYVQDSSVTFATINNTCGGVDLRYTHETDFDFESNITAAIAAQDTFGNWLHDTISFTTELSWDTTDYSIDTLGGLTGFAVRSRPSGSFSDQASYFANESGAYTVMPGGAPYSISFTPGRSFILNDLDANIWAYNPETGTQTQLTFNPLAEKYPALSPNGHTLAFTREGDIVLYNLADSTEDILASTAQGGRDFAFSPDSLYLAYRSGAGSMNPKVFIWDLEEREDIAHPMLYNEVDCFDWAPDMHNIAVISNENLYFWRVGADYPILLFSSTNLRHANVTENYVYFVESTPMGDKIMRIPQSGGTAEIIIDLTTEASTVEALALNTGSEMIYAKNNGGDYTIEYYKIGLEEGHTVTDELGQVRQIVWY